MPAYLSLRHRGRLSPRFPDFPYCHDATLLGALVVVLIALLAKTRNYYIAGLLPLFPTFALLAHYIVGTERGSEALRMTILFGIWAVIPYLVYLTSLYTFVGVMRLPLALSSAVVCWGIAAWLLIIAWRRWYGLN